MLTHRYPLASPLVGVVSHSIVLPLVTFTLWKSMKNLRATSAADVATSVLDNDAYLSPFGLLIMWSIISLVIVTLTSLLGFLGT